MNYWFKEKLCEFCECWAIAKLLISICIHRWLHLISCETFSKCFRKLWVFRCRNFLLLTLVFNTTLWLLLRNHRQTFILREIKIQPEKNWESEKNWRKKKNNSGITHTGDLKDLSRHTLCHRHTLPYVWTRFVGISIVTCAD